MGQQTIISVPDWAYSAVATYINDAFYLSQETAGIPGVFITSGYGAVAQAFIDPSTGGVFEVIVDDQGQYYSDVPLVTFISNDSTQTGSSQVPIIEGGVIVGYQTAIGTGATAHATLTNGKVTLITVDTPGSDYQVEPTVVISARGGGAFATANVVNGAVSTIDVTNGGLNFTLPPTVLLFGGSGSGATAVATIDVNGAVTVITVVHGGSGYGGLVPGAMAAYPGIINAPQDANELLGISKLATRGASGNPTIQAAYTLADNLINGDNLAGLPAALLSKISTQALAAFALVSALIGEKALYVGDPDTTFLAQTLTANTPATYLARLNAKIENDNYHAERASMDTAIGLGIELAKQSAVDAETLRKSGLYVREYLQGTYERSHKLFIETEELNVYKLEILGNALRAITGSQQTTTSSDQTPSGIMQAVGIASAGAGIYNALNAAGVFAGVSSGVSLGASSMGAAAGAGAFTEAAGGLFEVLPELAL